MITTDIKNIFILCKFLFKKILNKQTSETVKYTNIHSLTFRVFSPNGGRGGGSGVLSCQKILLSDLYQNYRLKYSFYEENEFSVDRKNELWDLWGGTLFAIKKTMNEKNAVYITHDYGTAFGLYLMGKKYIQITHLQGPRVEEKINFGEKFSLISKMIIQWCEKKSFENANCVCFPSYGAYEYFCKSNKKIVKKEDFKLGPILYNTLYAFPDAEKYQEVKKDNNCITFLSIGQLTVAKGIDRCPHFIKKLLSQTSTNRIRWIFVGKGPLREQIIKECETLKKEYNNFSYIYINGCSYPQMQYLQDISDVYLMLHRISIFDLATLEVMNKGKVIILSDVGGNPEFNLENNIFLWNEKNCNNVIKTFLESDLSKIGVLNKKIYDNYFSNEKFKLAYYKIMAELVSEP